MNKLLTYAFVAFQYVLPRHWLTAVVYSVAHIRNRRIKDFLINRFVPLYKVDLDDVKLDVPRDFQCFNDFFVRELKDGAREVDTDLHSIVSPVDGTVSVAGTLRADSILQAKGLDYSLHDLLATDLEDADVFINGRFATIYLAPYNYHRVHAPFDGVLVAARYVPGDLFSVNAATVSNVKGLFRRNERLIMRLRTSRGPAVVVFVGALNVGSISTPWTGEIRPRKSGVVDAVDIGGHDTSIKKGDLLGWFNMGSTVILLLPDGVCEWRSDLGVGDSVRMGESIGEFSGAAE